VCHSAGGELEQIQFLFGHVSIQTTERYLGCKQRIRAAVNDCIGTNLRAEWFGGIQVADGPLAVALADASAFSRIT
jgi:hypothetical protein